MTTFTDKELIKEIKERISSPEVRDDIERRAYEIALASLEAEPVLYQSCTRPTGIAVFRGRNGKNVVVRATKTICALQTRLTMPVG